MLSIGEYAQRAGISARAVRYRIADGSLPARKIGGRWVIDGDHRPPQTRRAGRKLSAASFDLLAGFMDGDDAGMTPDARRRARERAHRIGDGGVEQVREFSRRPDVIVGTYRTSAQDLEELRHDARLHLTGISHPDAEVYGPVLDAYVSPSDHADIELFHMLEPVPRSAANVTLRMQNPPPRVRKLHLIADLLDDGDPRSQHEAELMLNRLMQAMR